MGLKDLEDRLARVEAELSYLKWQNSLKNDSLLSRMARRMTRMELLGPIGSAFNTITLLGNSPNPTSSFISQYHNSGDTGDIISIRSNLKQSGNSLVLVDATQNGWNLNFGAFGNAFNVQTFQVGGSLIDLFTLSSSGSVLMNRNASGLLQNDTGGINRSILNLDASNNLDVGYAGMAGLITLMGKLWAKVGSTGSTTNTLGANGPNTTTTPYSWITCLAPDGTTAYFPVWK